MKLSQRQVIAKIVVQFYTEKSIVRGILALIANLFYNDYGLVFNNKMLGEIYNLVNKQYPDNKQSFNKQYK